MDTPPLMIIAALAMLAAIIVLVYFFVIKKKTTPSTPSTTKETFETYHRRRGHLAFPSNIDVSYKRAARQLKCKKHGLRWSWGPTDNGVCPPGFLHTGVSATWPKRQCLGCAH